MHSDANLPGSAGPSSAVPRDGTVSRIQHHSSQPRGMEDSRRADEARTACQNKSTPAIRDNEVGRFDVHPTNYDDNEYRAEACTKVRPQAKDSVHATGNMMNTSSEP